MFDGGVDMAYARAGSWETLYTVSVLLIIINATNILFFKGLQEQHCFEEHQTHFLYLNSHNLSLGVYLHATHTPSP